ncbi:hypothetical protein RMN57_13095 [Kitasatospora sp. CM 4170]|uniref:Uncharacterized protein n=1 Tax=Kitasatospora aburaviensis TaxID=67265 RepID=A0ABW1F5E4_9ACTN|nr:hypothetical protein [Kitasatospora sp. CM 4170]WNM45590.1 hypothetical protein RMN57_13095 [Kitasatospora sp. CM 4170]
MNPSAYTQDLIRQRDRAIADLRAAEDELQLWRQQGRRADRYRAAWQSARRRAASWNALYRAIAADRDQRLGSGPWITLRGHQAALRRVHARRSEADIARFAAEARVAELTANLQSTEDALTRVMRLAETLPAGLRAQVDAAIGTSPTQLVARWCLREELEQADAMYVETACRAEQAEARIAAARAECERLVAEVYGSHDEDDDATRDVCARVLAVLDGATTSTTTAARP